jgi:hypothetical protein
MTTTRYTAEEIAAAVELYAAFHGIEPGAVDVCRNYEGDTANVVGFRLSRDTDGQQHGGDEKHGQF